MSRILRKGTKLSVDGRQTPVTLLADVEVIDSWGSDDHFAGWLFNTGNLELNQADLVVLERDEMRDGVNHYCVYDRAYGSNAIAELTLVSCEPYAEQPAEIAKRDKAVAEIARLDAEIALLNTQIASPANVEKPDAKLVTKRDGLLADRAKAATAKAEADTAMANPPKPSVKKKTPKDVKPGAEEETVESLMNLRKDDLVALAHKRGIKSVPDSMTKEEIALSILGE